MNPATACIVVVNDNAHNASQVARQLKQDFTGVRTVVCSDSDGTELDGLNADVLVMAFDSVVKSERFCLGLYRRGSPAVQRSHRIVVLCAKEEVPEVFEMCKKSTFDDYVLFWPHSFDGTRLSMTVWTACRTLEAAPADLPPRAELFSHARHLALIEDAVAAVEPSDAGSQALRERIRPAVEGTRAVAAAIRKIKPLLLLVDDDEIIRSVVGRALDPERWELVTASDAVGALTQLRHRVPDAVLMDIGLPGTDGLELTRRLKKDAATAHVPVVMLTSDSRRETLRDSLQAGAVDFLVKPVSRDKLQAKLDKILSR